MCVCVHCMVYVQCVHMYVCACVIQLTTANDKCSNMVFVQYHSHSYMYTCHSVTIELHVHTYHVLCRSVHVCLFHLVLCVVRCSCLPCPVCQVWGGGSAPPPAVPPTARGPAECV